MQTLQERLKIAMAGPPRVSQAALARACHITAPSVNDWISGKTKSIEGENLLNAAAFLKVSPLWLATGKGPMREHAPTGRDNPEQAGSA
ncbi:UNVERIFIED_CONTAM: helix-turn-helix transcriptional regulator, partial [Pseudomonas aeruginosa]